MISSNCSSNVLYFCFIVQFDELAIRWLNTCSTLNDIDEEVITRFSQTAKELIEEKGAIQAVAGLIAIATGQTSVVRTSLINQQEV